MARADKGHENLLSVSEAAELLGVAPSALRYYEREGLVKPRRSEWSNYRGYSFDAIIELTDVIRYRNAGIAVKDLPGLFSSPIAQTLDVLDAEIDRKLDELEELRLSLSAATRLSQLIRRRMTLGTIGWREMEAPGFTRLVRFELYKREVLEEYLRRRDSLRYVIYFDSPDRPDAFVDCAVAEAGDKGETVWQAKKGSRYVEFLLTTTYGESGENNLAEWRERLVEQGTRIGCVVAEYLTYDIEPGTGRRIDCYDAWGEVL